MSDDIKPIDPKPGLYKLDGTTPLYAASRVSSKSYDLAIAQAEKSVSNDGWCWFASRAEAEAAYGITSQSETYCARQDCPDRVTEVPSEVKQYG